MPNDCHECAEAEAASQEAETASQQAETAREVAELCADRLAARLRAMGIDPDE